jgi:hypothetical protein
LTIMAASVSGEGFAGDASGCVKTLHAGDSCTVNVTFDPATTGAKSGALTVTATALPDVVVPITGTGTQTLLAAGPASLDLGNQDVDDGATTPQAATITNTGTEPVTLTGVNLSGGDFDRPSGAADDCANGRTLNAGDTCRVRVRFDPSSTGDKSGSVSVTSNAAEVTIPLSGKGIQTDLARDPTALDFGTLNVGAPASAAKESTLTNDGTQPIALSGVTVQGTDASQFKLLGGDASDCAAGVNLAAGATCKVRAAFDPSSKGAKAAVVHVASDAGPDTTVSLAGTATPLASLRLPALKTRAPKGKRLRLTVVVANGPVKNVLVTLKSGRKLVGSASARNLAGGRHTLTLKLKRALGPGRYVSSVRGKDRFGNAIKGKAGKVTLTAPVARRRGSGGGGGGGGGGSGGSG